MKQRPLTKLPVLTTFLAIIFSGCIQQIALNSMGGIMDTGFVVLNEEQDLDLADKSIASNLKLLETIIKKDPDNTHYLLLASMGYSSYALGFAEDDSIERGRMFYLRGKEYGMKVLRHNAKFAAVEEKGTEEFRAALASFTNDDIPAVFWTAIGWGSAISTDLTNPTSLAGLGKVEAMMLFVHEKDPAYFYGGADFFLGTFYGSRPQMLGGDSTQSKKHFEACLKINGGKFLMDYVYYARSYAVQTQNREFFEQCLTRVDTTSLDILPEARLSNAIAKKKAKILRAKIDELF